MNVFESAVNEVINNKSTFTSNGMLDSVLKQAAKEINNITMAQLKVVPYTKTLSLLRKAESWLKHLSISDNLHSITYSNMANVYRSNSDFDSALKFAEKALRVAKKNMSAGTGDQDCLACAHLTSCCILSQLENHEVAFFFKLMLKYYEKRK